MATLGCSIDLELRLSTPATCPQSDPTFSHSDRAALSLLSLHRSTDLAQDELLEHQTACRQNPFVQPGHATWQDVASCKEEPLAQSLHQQVPTPQAPLGLVALGPSVLQGHDREHRHAVQDKREAFPGPKEEDQSYSPCAHDPHSQRALQECSYPTYGAGHELAKDVRFPVHGSPRVGPSPGPCRPQSYGCTGYREVHSPHSLAVLSLAAVPSQPDQGVSQVPATTLGVAAGSQGCGTPLGSQLFLTIAPVTPFHHFLASGTEEAYSRATASPTPATASASEPCWNASRPPGRYDLPESCSPERKRLCGPRPSNPMPSNPGNPWDGHRDTRTTPVGPRAWGPLLQRRSSPCAPATPAMRSTEGAPSFGRIVEPPQEAGSARRGCTRGVPPYSSPCTGAPDNGGASGSSDWASKLGPEEQDNVGPGEAEGGSNERSSPAWRRRRSGKPRRNRHGSDAVWEMETFPCGDLVEARLVAPPEVVGHGHWHTGQGSSSLEVVAREECSARGRGHGQEQLQGGAVIGQHPMASATRGSLQSMAVQEHPVGASVQAQGYAEDEHPPASALTSAAGLSAAKWGRGNVSEMAGVDRAEQGQGLGLEKQGGGSDPGTPSAASSDEAMELAPRFSPPRPLRRKTNNVHRFGMDGHVWRKYSHKMLQGNQCERIYYSCAEKDSLGCKARKIVDRPKECHLRGDSSCDVVTINGQHNHKPKRIAVAALHVE